MDETDVVDNLSNLAYMWRGMIKRNVFLVEYRFGGVTKLLQIFLLIKFLWDLRATCTDDVDDLLFDKYDTRT